MALEQIIAHKVVELETKRVSIERYKNALTPATKSLRHALLATKPAFICEIKFASPSRGLLKQANVLDIAHVYEPFANAISVLADEKFFGGSPNFVAQVGAQSARPVLFKDVIVSPLQVYEARHASADAVLLMLSVLDDQTYRACAELAASLNMEVICEVHTEEEMHRAKTLSASIIGINNRNLKTLEIDLETSKRLLPLAPKNALLIVESGISSRREIKQFKDRVAGFLIGTSLMKSPRTDLALRELMFGRVKICGLTNPHDAQSAYDAGAYYGGLNFFAKSKRAITKGDAREIMNAAPLKWGGVFVNQPVKEVLGIATELNLDFVQLHGDESARDVHELRASLPETCEIWKALRVTNEINEPALNVDRFLIDSFSTHAFGGTGITFDWQVLRNNERRHAYVIAGGINVNNIEAASDLLPFAIDIASGVEDDDPRQKSHAKLLEIFQKLRA